MRRVEDVILTSDLTAHERHTWRCHLHDFAPRPF
jgi:hypothetical protein